MVGIDCRVEIRHDEFESLGLLHTQIDPALFKNLRIWDEKDDAWRVMRPGEAPSDRSAILVLHLWADYCKPCREEFPILRDLEQQAVAKFKERVEFIYLSESASAVETARFFAANQGRMPRGRYYHDSGEAISKILQDNLPTGRLTLPITMLLDERRVVRQAIIGSIIPHRSDLPIGIAKLVRLAGDRPH